MFLSCVAYFVVTRMTHGPSAPLAQSMSNRSCPTSRFGMGYVPGGAKPRRVFRLKKGARDTRILHHVVTRIDYDTSVELVQWVSISRVAVPLLAVFTRSLDCSVYFVFRQVEEVFCTYCKQQISPAVTAADLKDTLDSLVYHHKERKCLASLKNDRGAVFVRGGKLPGAARKTTSFRQKEKLASSLCAGETGTKSRTETYFPFTCSRDCVLTGSTKLRPFYLPSSASLPSTLMLNRRLVRW